MPLPVTVLPFFLVVPDPDQDARWRELRLTLSVNGSVRQDSLAANMIFGPAATLSELAAETNTRHDGMTMVPWLITGRWTGSEDIRDVASVVAARP